MVGIKQQSVCLQNESNNYSYDVNLRNTKAIMSPLLFYGLNLNETFLAKNLKNIHLTYHRILPSRQNVFREKDLKNVKYIFCYYCESCIVKLIMNKHIHKCMKIHEFTLCKVVKKRMRFLFIVNPINVNVPVTNLCSFLILN